MSKLFEHPFFYHLLLVDITAIPATTPLYTRRCAARLLTPQGLGLSMAGSRNSGGAGIGGKEGGKRGASKPGGWGVLGLGYMDGWMFLRSPSQY